MDSFDCLTLEQKLRLGIGLVTWFLILGGWFVVNWQNNRRESRKELRAAIDSLRSDILSLRTTSIKYHTTMPVSGDGNAILVLFKRLSRSTNRLNVKRREINSVGAYMNAFKQAVTLSNFQSHRHRVHHSGSDFIDLIECSVEELLDELEDCFCKKYSKRNRALQSRTK